MKVLSSIICSTFLFINCSSIIPISKSFQKMEDAISYLDEENNRVEQLSFYSKYSGALNLIILTGNLKDIKNLAKYGNSPNEALRYSIMYHITNDIYFAEANPGYGMGRLDSEFIKYKRELVFNPTPQEVPLDLMRIYYSICFSFKDDQNKNIANMARDSAIKLKKAI